MTRLKRVLITGANSYVGTNVEKWLMREPEKYYVETLDMKDPNWINFDFSGFDVVFHVAGIAHVTNKKSNDDLYYKINRDLAVQTAHIAKNAGVKQFIFMSSMIIFGEDNDIYNKSHIDISKYNPINAYGKSKLEADLAIQKLRDGQFAVSVVRTPIIYGPQCKGNFPRLEKIALLLFVVPKIHNQRSMIYIDNFSEFIKCIIDDAASDTFYPQNSRYASTSEIIHLIRKYKKKKTIFTKLLNFPLKFLSKYMRFIRKVFGNKTYDFSISNQYGFDYNIVNYEETIYQSITK